MVEVGIFKDIGVARNGYALTSYDFSQVVEFCWCIGLVIANSCLPDKCSGLFAGRPSLDGVVHDNIAISIIINIII